MAQELKLQVLIEEDTAEQNFTAYIPALRLGARGDTLEEVRENAKDLVLMEYEAAKRLGKPFPKDTALIETLDVTIAVKQ